MSEFYRKKSSAFVSFIKEKGFYLVLVATVLAVGVIGCLSLAIPEEKPEAQGQNASESEPKKTAEVPEVNPDDKKTVLDTEDKQGEDKPVIVEPEEIDYYAAPIACAVSVGYSGSVPVFSETLKEWHLHQGVDYATAESALVTAVMSGVVEEIYEDDLMGNTVVVLQNDGIRAVYQSLADVIRVKTGQTVRTGDIIGSTGQSAEEECAEGNHLHLAMVYKGAYIDPLEKITSEP